MFPAQNNRFLKTTVVVMGVVFFLCLAVSGISAQRKFARTYPAGRSVRLQLLNRTGTVTVEGWNRSDVRIEASMEEPAANIEPQSLSGVIMINLVHDNQGRG